ncbi:MAG: hypothetical protein U5P10_17825 [Spirochaetia bacterium]|nr:hypothetical protein [Spirochaetia bacterium]
MYVSATTMQNGFGKYLRLCKKENVIISKNGKKRALLLYYPRSHDGYEGGRAGLRLRDQPEEAAGKLGDLPRNFFEMTENKRETV